MHNPYSDLPKPMPVKYRGYDTLLEMLTSFQKTTDTLFYEVLSIPLPEYEAKKSLKVSWHNAAPRRSRSSTCSSTRTRPSPTRLLHSAGPPAAGGAGDAGAAAAAAGSSADGAGERAASCG